MQSENDLISVIVPVYNVKPFLCEALESVLHQTYNNLEIIVVDDGSTDGSSEICDQYGEADERIIVIHQSNRGLSAARNAGLDIMTGRVVAFLDSDDVLSPDFVEKLYKTMISGDYDLVVGERWICHSLGKLTVFFSNEAETTKVQNLGRLEALRALLYGSLNTVVWAKLYRQELWKEIRFIEGHVYEDTPALAQVLDICNSVCTISDVVYIKRTWNESITATKNIINARDGALSANWFLNFIENHVPEVYTNEDLQYARKRNLFILLSMLDKCAGIKGPESHLLKLELKRMISEVCQKIKMRSCPVKMKVTCTIACHCPSLFRIWRACSKEVQIVEKKLLWIKEKVF